MIKKLNSIRFIVLFMFLFSNLALAQAFQAQNNEKLGLNLNTASSSSSNPEEKEFSLWGEPGKDAVYIGMWSFHLSILFNADTNENWQHDLAAVAYSGFIAGTFINSFYDRCYVFGLHRSIYRTGKKDGFSTDLGYNLGVVKGYDSRLVSFADDLPFLPFLQITFDISWKMLGIQLSHVGSVLTAGFYVEYEI